MKPWHRPWLAIGTVVHSGRCGRVGLAKPFLVESISWLPLGRAASEGQVSDVGEIFGLIYLSWDYVPGGCSSEIQPLAGGMMRGRPELCSASAEWSRPTLPSDGPMG